MKQFKFGKTIIFAETKKEAKTIFFRHITMEEQKEEYPDDL